VPAVAMAPPPPREIGDFYPPTSENKDCNKYPEMGNIEGNALFTYSPRQGLGKKE
jgi:hypothetical protein